MLSRFMGKWMNSNNRCEATDYKFAAEICQRCTVDGKKEIPYLQSGMRVASLPTCDLLKAISSNHFQCLVNLVSHRCHHGK